MSKQAKKKVAEARKRWKLINSAKKMLFDQGDHHIFAIDPATKSGWVSFLGQDEIKLGLKTLTGEKPGKKWSEFENWLTEQITITGSKYVGIEMPVYNRHSNAFLHHGKLAGVAEKVAYKTNVKLIYSTPTEIKKLACGKGNANKKLVLEGAKTHFNYQGNDDNESDAIWIYFLTFLKINNLV